MVATKFLVPVALFVIASLYSTAAFDANIQHNALLMCKVFRPQAGYGYKEFFDTKLFNFNTSDTLNLFATTVYVIGEKDAHILLSSKKSPVAEDLVYEIVIGGYENTVSELRTRQLQRASRDVYSRVMSNTYLTKVDIRLARNGVLNIFASGYGTQPLLQFSGPQAVPVNYLSFSTYGKTPLVFHYDCPNV